MLSSTGYHGAEQMAAELIRRLTELGVTNHVGVFQSHRNSNTEILQTVRGSVEDGVLFPCHGRLDVGAVLALRRYLNTHGIDVIHSHKYKTNFYAFLARMGTGCRLVSTCHNWLGNSLSMRFYAWLDKYMLRSFDAVIGVSDEVMQELQRRLNNGRIRKIENGIDLQRFSRRIEKDAAKEILGLEGRQVVGFVGRLSREKGVSFLLHAAQQLIALGHDAHFLIVGDGEHRDALKREAHSLEIDSRVLFTGNRSDTPLLYSAMDVFVLPSLKEAFPMVILEAMAAGAPIVATRVGDIGRIVEDGVSALLVEPRDAPALIRAIHSLLTDRPKADRLAGRAVERVAQHYSSIQMARKYHTVYTQVAGRN